jgi:hypothetical protein
MTDGPYGAVTGGDHLPLDLFGGTAGAGGAATDYSADVNVNGGNNVAANAAAEAREIAAVPDPQSPAGQAAILAIIEKYQALSAGTVQGAAADQQTNGSRAASHGDEDGGHHSDGGSGSGSGGGSGLLDIVSQLLGSSGSSLQGMSPSGQGASPLGQQANPLGAGANPFGDPYGAQQAGAANPAANPFTETLTSQTTPPTTPATNTDPLTTTPPGTAAANPNTVTNPFTTAANTPGGQNGAPAAPTLAAGPGTIPKPGGAGANNSGVDLDAFSAGDGGAVPADPATTATSGRQ